MTTQPQMHPLAEAIIRFYIGSQDTNIDEVTFLTDLFGLLDSLPPARIARAARDMLAATRLLVIEGLGPQASSLARRIKSSANRATVRAGGATLLAEVPEKFLTGSYANRSCAAVADPSEAKNKSRPLPLETKWKKMSDVQRRKLARLADEVLEQG